MVLHKTFRKLIKVNKMNHLVEQAETTYPNNEIINKIALRKNFLSVNGVLHLRSSGTTPSINKQTFSLKNHGNLKN